MRYMRMLAVMAALVFLHAVLVRGAANLGAKQLDRTDLTNAGPTSFPLVKASESPSETILPPHNFAFGRLFVSAFADDGKEDGKGGGKKNPPPRSVHCPPDKDDRHNRVQNGGDDRNKDNQDKDKDKDKDKNKGNDKDDDHHDDCGKGDDGRNP